MKSHRIDFNPKRNIVLTVKSIDYIHVRASARLNGCCMDWSTIYLKGDIKYNT